MIHPHLPPESAHRLHWLERIWQSQRVKLLGLNNRLTQPATSSSGLARLLEQIGILKVRENAILSEIEELERKHRGQRRLKRVRYAQPQNDNLAESPPQPKRERQNLGWLLWIALMLQHKNRDKA